MEIAYRPIGVIHSPFLDIEGMPIQPRGAQGVAGWVEVYEEYVAGLKDLDGFSHVILLYHFHRVTATKLIVTPFLDTKPRGVFATRAPKRPNPIGLSVVKLCKIEAQILYIENIDILDGTPLLDIKPYVPEFDQHPASRVGWLEHACNTVHLKKSDDRFA